MHAFTITRPFTVVQRKRDIRSFAIDRDEDSKLRLRSEAEAPFRLLRLSLYGAAVGGSSIGLLVNLTQIVGAVASRPGAPTLTEALKNIAIDVVGVIIFAWLFGSDWKARGLQMKRLSRESELGKLSFLTISSKILKVSDLRSSARVVIVAGTQEQVQRAMKEAENYRTKLTEAGVFIIQVPVDGNEAVAAEETSEEDLRWKGKAIRLEEWRQWFKDQMEESNVSFEAGLYVGLRMDGRVRASGKGMPPWFRIANELPPLRGMWSGFGDGFDGPV